MKRVNWDVVLALVAVAVFTGAVWYGLYLLAMRGR